MSDKEIQAEVERAIDRINEEEEWLEAVASWERAGKPREPRIGASVDQIS